MRLSFGNGEHADFVMEEGAVSLGHAAGNTFVLNARDVSAHHARLIVDARGTVLEVLDPQARTHVNARPVREKALLRSGDILCLGQVTIALKADRDDLVATVVPPETDPAAEAVAPSQPPRVILRGVSGSHYGKTIAVDRRLSIGNGHDCGLVLDEARIAPRHATVEHSARSIYLRCAAGRDAFVNGVRVHSAVLHPGDQVAFERSHFIVEAPGLPLRGHGTPAEFGRGDEEGDSADEATRQPTESSGGIWWLIGAAAVIAAAIAWVIWRGSGG